MKTKVKQQAAGQLIVFTDALGSTEKDEVALSGALRSRGIPKAHRAIIKLRDSLFAGQIQSLKPKNGWRIIKSVGDALVLSAEIPESDSAGEVVQACVADLFEAWKHFNGKTVKIRIAVHYAELSHIVSGSALSTTLRKRFPQSELSTLNAFITSLKSDMFGPGINRSARLANAPSGSLFVLSQNVVLKILNRTEAFSIEELRGFYSMPTTFLGKLPARGPIPLVKVKGVGSIGLASKQEPWWIWELVDKDHSVAQTFAAENKRFQVVRVLQADLPEKKALQDRAQNDKVAVALDTAFEKHLDATLALSFFSDLVLKVEDVWTFYKPSDDRDFDSQEPRWETFMTTPSKFLPYYAVFSSSPNEATDAIVREGLIDVPSVRGKAKLVAISYQVQHGTRWAKDKTVEEGTGPSRRVYLIFFQVRSSALRDAAKPAMLFRGRKTQFGKDGYLWNLISMGVIRGDKDGFLLASLVTGDPAEAGKVLQEYLGVQCKDDRKAPQGFWERIAPIKVLVCKPRNSIGRMNLAWLKECVERA